MADLLLQTHTAGGLHGTGSKSVLSPQAKYDNSPSHLDSGRAIRQVVSRTLRDASNAFLSWKDGLSPEERETVRLRHQKTEESLGEMKSVSASEIQSPVGTWQDKKVLR